MLKLPLTYGITVQEVDSMPRVHVTLQLRDGGDSHGHAMDPDGSVGPRHFKSHEWRPWTVVRAFTADAEPFLFLLNTASGDVSVHRLQPAGVVGSQTYANHWTRGWTTASFYTIGGTTFLMLLKRESGQVHVHEMDRGSVGRRVAEYDWTSGWTHAETCTVDGSPFLFLLKRSTGEVHVHRLDPDGTVGARVFTADWSAGWSAVRFFTMGNATYLFLLKASDGTVHVHRMESDGDVGTRVDTQDWSSGWTTVETFSVGARQFLFLLKESDGTVHIHALRNDGNVGERVATYSWSAGWTAAQFYRLDGTTSLLLNKVAGRRPLRRTFVEHTALGAPIGLYVTDDEGRLRDSNGDLGLNSLSNTVDLRVLCHNSVIKAPNVLIDHWIDVDDASDGTTVVLDADTVQLDRFRVVNRAVEVYERVFRQFEPFATRGDFPLGKPTSLERGRDRLNRIELVYPDFGPGLAWVEPKSLGTGYPVIHVKEKSKDPRLFGGNGFSATLIPSELSHGLHFSLLSQPKRNKIFDEFGRFIAFDLLAGGDGTHELNKATDPTVAFIEAMDHFASRFFVYLQQNPGRTVNADLRRDFIHSELVQGIVGTLDGPLGSGTVTPNSGITGSSIEGAVYGAIFLDLARRNGIGLTSAVAAYFDSEALTFGQFRSWAENERPQLAAALTEVAETWKM